MSSFPPIGITPHGFRDDEIGTLSAQEVPEPGAYRFAESLNGHEEVPPRGCAEGPVTVAAVARYTQDGRRKAVCPSVANPSNIPWDPMEGSQWIILDHARAIAIWGILWDKFASLKITVWNMK